MVGLLLTVSWHAAAGSSLQLPGNAQQPPRTAATAAGQLPVWSNPPTTAPAPKQPEPKQPEPRSTAAGTMQTPKVPSEAASKNSLPPPPPAKPTAPPLSAAKEQPPPPKSPSAPDSSTSSGVAGGSKSGAPSGSSSSSGSAAPAQQAAPVPVTTVAPTLETVKPSLSCPPGKTVRVYAASRTRMCVLPKATASEGLLWNAIGQQVSYSQAEACHVARCPEGLQPEVGTDGGYPIVTARSAQQQQQQQQQRTAGGTATPLAPPAAGAGAAVAPTPTIITVTEPAGPAAVGRRLLGLAAVQQDVFVVMSFAASCFSVCE